jgi:hypothetical protein
MPRLITDWTPFPPCPVCIAKKGQQCVDLRPREDGELHPITYPHIPRRGLDIDPQRLRTPRGSGNAASRNYRSRAAVPYPELAAERTRTVNALLAERGYGPAVKVKSAAGTETVVTIGEYDPQELKAALRTLKWQGMQIDRTPTTLVITQR